MMGIIRKLFHPVATPREELRRGANVIADAVQAGRDDEIAELSALLAEERVALKKSRGRVNIAIRAASEVGRGIRAAGDAIDSAIDPTARRITGHD